MKNFCSHGTELQIFVPLGFENTDGPIAGPFRVSPILDVIILGYTCADNDSIEIIEAQKHSHMNYRQYETRGLRRIENRQSVCF